MFPHRRFLMRHMAAVPKGFLRYQVLELLADKPMSGSELMSEIARRTNGKWRPSPGSIYPLLAYLQDNSFVKELLPEGGIKRYELTDAGRKMLGEQRKMKEKFRNEGRFFAPPSMPGLWFRIPPEKAAESRDSIKRLMVAMFELGTALERDFSDEAFEQSRMVVEEAAKKIEGISRRLKEAKED